MQSQALEFSGQCDWDWKDSSSLLALTFLSDTQCLKGFPLRTFWAEGLEGGGWQWDSTGEFQGWGNFNGRAYAKLWVWFLSLGEEGKKVDLEEGILRG